MSLLGRGLLARELAHNARFERAAADPRDSQARLLLSLTGRNADTVFGHDHDFASIRGPADFARSVPIRDYEGFRPYVERVAEGEGNVLTADVPTMFVTTSGTTGEPKLIPVTERWRAQMAALQRLWMYRAVRDHPRCFDGKLLLVVSPAIEGRTPRGFPYGAMSGLTSQHVPWLARRQYAIPPEDMALLQDHEERYLLIMRLAMAQSVSAIGTPNPTTLLRLADVAAVHSEEIIRAIRDGTPGISTESLTAGSGSRARFQRLRTALRPDPARAKFLERVVSVHGRLSPVSCWPGLVLVGCWLGGSAGVHASRLQDHYGTAPPIRDLGFLASEGRFTIPVEDGTAAGPLAVHANYYEFVPEGEMGAASPTVLTADELTQGERYYILLTGGNGLYRYDINDVVEVQGFHRRAPSLAFVRKGRDTLNITGEKLHLNHVQSAVRTAEQRSDQRIWQWRLIPNVEDCHYDLLVEVHDASIDDARAAAMLRSFDGSLCAQNIEYESKRMSRRLGPPRLHVMRAGWSEDVCRADFRDGRRETQYKWPLLCDGWDPISRAQIIATFVLACETR